MSLFSAVLEYNSKINTGDYICALSEIVLRKAHVLFFLLSPVLQFPTRFIWWDVWLSFWQFLKETCQSLRIREDLLMSSFTVFSWVTILQICCRYKHNMPRRIYAVQNCEGTFWCSPYFSLKSKIRKVPLMGGLTFSKVTRFKKHFKEPVMSLFFLLKSRKHALI